MTPDPLLFPDEQPDAPTKPVSPSIVSDRSIVASLVSRLRVTDGDGVDFSQLHLQLGVREAVLVHGTFMGNDPFGISAVLRTFARKSGPLKTPLLTLADVLRGK